MENIRIKNCATTDYRFVHRLSKRNMEEYVKKYWGKWDSRKFKTNFKKENIKIINYNKRKIGFFEVTRKGSMETRRAVLFIALPSDMKTETKDFPCTTSLQFLIRKNRLYLIANMRSNDLVLGFTYDAASFTLFQEKMLLELRQYYPKLKMGKYIHIAASIHIYKKHYEMIKIVLKEKNKNLKISIPKMSDLKEFTKLHHNEEIIRIGRKEKLEDLTDKFCNWCQKILLNKNT